MTTKILTFRVPAPIYSDLCTSAAEQGIPVSAHIRHLIEQEHQANQVSELRAELLARIDNLTTALAPASPVPFQALDEILLLSRATAAHLNPQLVTQVRAKLINQK